MQIEVTGCERSLGGSELVGAASEVGGVALALRRSLDATHSRLLGHLVADALRRRHLRFTLLLFSVLVLLVLALLVLALLVLFFLVHRFDRCQVNWNDVSHVAVIDTTGNGVSYSIVR